MAPPRYIYQRRGGPLVTWNRLRPPGQTKAGDAKALGSLGATDVFGTPRRLPRGGAPEYISDGFSGLNGCGCTGVGATATEYGAEPAGSRSNSLKVSRGGSFFKVALTPADEADGRGISYSMGEDEKPSVLDSIPTRKIGALAATFHGYKRNGSIGWALLWGLAGAAAPLTTNVIAVAQGFGKAK